MSEWGCNRELSIDGELEDIRREKVFVLGYEFGKIDTYLQHDKAFDEQIHSDNLERVLASARHHLCDVEWFWVNDDWVVVRYDG